jgi:hypothetical protein
MTKEIKAALDTARKAYKNGAEYVYVFLDSRDRPLSEARWDIIADGNGDNILLAIDRETCMELQRLGYVTTINSYGGVHKRACYDFIKEKL